MNTLGNIEELQELVKKMEEMAGDPRERGKRQPGEKCKYETYRERTSAVVLPTLPDEQ